MSLRLFYGDQGTNTRRRSRLTDVLSQGIVDHRAELEERLRVREVPRGAAGLQSVPLLASQPVGAAPESVIGRSAGASTSQFIELIHRKYV